jgi:hypothetical protein
MFENTQNPASHRQYGERHHVWQGRSGRRYVHAVYPADGCPDLSDAVYVAVGRDASGSRRPLAIEGKTGFAETVFAAARRGTWPGGGGIDEIHVHFVARARDGLRQAIEDLSAEFGLIGADA